MDNINNLCNQIRGKFTIFIDKIITFQKDELYGFYNITKGSIKNAFELKNQYYKNLYLIRMKTLRDIVDKNKKFKDFDELINYIYQYNNPILNYIPIAFCPNDLYSPLAYTSIISILTTKNYNSYISFYLIISKNFSHKNFQLFESLYEQFDYFNITYIQMDNRYEKAFTTRYITQNAYFRLSLGELLPHLNKIIYLDSDTICLKDLYNLYNLNFMGNIFLAVVKSFKPGNLSFTVNSGILLLNLVKMRIMKIEKKAINLLNNGFKHPSFHDQAIINIFFRKYIGFLPPEYNTYTFNFKKVKKYKNSTGELYDFDSLYFQLKFPSIIHYKGPPRKKTYLQEDWYYFARKSKYFQKRSHNLSNIFNYSI